MMKSHNYNHFPFFLMGIFLVGVWVFFNGSPAARADLGSPALSSGVISNEAETAYYSTPYFPIELTPGTTTSLKVVGTAVDPDGGSDITDIEMVYYRSGVGNGCSENARSCYRVVCSLGSVNDFLRNFTCTIPMSYVADSTDETGDFPEEIWRGYMTLTDTSDNVTSQDMYVDADVSPLIAAEFPAISFGELILSTATDSSTNAIQTFVQKGNTQADVSVYGEPLSCDGGGEVPLSDIKWSLTDVGFSDGGATALTDSPVSTAKTIDYVGGASASLYWNVQAPAQASGECSGSISFDISPSV